MENQPIKILHYCWFGGNPLPDNTVGYMESWKKYLPDFEIMRWDESNFDVNSVPFVAQAYKEKKWAFVSDYVRCYALYKYGGLYVDTDVEIIRGMDDLLTSSFVAREHPGVVAPGLILYAAQPQMEFYGELLNRYKEMEFSVSDMESITSPIIFTRLLLERGLSKTNELQQIDDITVYPMDYFNPIGDDISARPKITDNTRSIHWYQASWLQSYDYLLFQKRKKHGYFWGTVLFSIAHPIAAFRRKAKKYNNKI